MIRLPLSLQNWNTDAFQQTFKHELCSLKPEHLPLQQGLQYSSYALTDKLSVAVLLAEEQKDFLQVKAGIFYSGIIAGCSCSDDPTPIDEVTEYCEVQVSINKQTAVASIQLLD